MTRVTIVAEIGQNMNGSIELAREMVCQAKACGADFVKFQKRNPRASVPRSMWETMRETPWGQMSYIEYRERLEFGWDEYRVIDALCARIGVRWFASAWDEDSVKFLVEFNPPYIKIPSAKLNDWNLLEAVRKTGIPSILSTGMSTPAQIDEAVHILRPTVVMHATSTYPCPKEELNLRCIQRLRETYPDVEVGYSGHEVGLATTIAAVGLGATWVERHVTLDRSMWGSDQSASVEFNGFKRLVDDIRAVEVGLGDGIKKVEPGELLKMAQLRG